MCVIGNIYLSFLWVLWSRTIHFKWISQCETTLEYLCVMFEDKVRFYSRSLVLIWKSEALELRVRLWMFYPEFWDTEEKASPQLCSFCRIRSRLSSVCDALTALLFRVAVSWCVAVLCSLTKITSLSK